MPNDKDSIHAEIEYEHDNQAGTLASLSDHKIHEIKMEYIFFGSSDDEENESDEDMWPSLTTKLEFL